MKTLRYGIEAILIHFLFFIFGILPAPAASAVGGFIGRSIGPILAVNRKADRHLSQSLPARSTEERKLILKGMWDNLGRVIAEYPHLETLAKHYVTVKGIENLNLFHPNARVFISGHLANWEVCGAVAYLNFNIPIELTYRAPNNPWTSHLLDQARSLKNRIKTHPKAVESGKALITCLKEERALGILIDQKYNEGIETRFFNQPAMTNPIFAHLAQKFTAALHPIQIIRTGGCNFELIVHPTIPTHTAEGQTRPLIDIIHEAQTLLETWIITHPADWIWLHRRWKG